MILALSSADGGMTTVGLSLDGRRHPCCRPLDAAKAIEAEPKLLATETFLAENVDEADDSSSGVPWKVCGCVVCGNDDVAQ